VKLPFRLARGAWVALIIIVAHAAAAWTFIHMRVRAPDLGPVFTMFLDDPRSESEADDPPDSPPARAEPPASTRANPVPPSQKDESRTQRQPIPNP